MTRCKIVIHYRFTFIFVLLLRRGLLLLLGVVRSLVGFGILTTGLLFRAFLALSLGSPGCRLFAFVLARLSACLPSLLGLKEALLNQRANLLGLL